MPHRGLVSCARNSLRFFCLGVFGPFGPSVSYPDFLSSKPWGLMKLTAVEVTAI